MDLGPALVLGICLIIAAGILKEGMQSLARGLTNLADALKDKPVEQPPIPIDWRALKAELAEMGAQKEKT